MDRVKHAHWVSATVILILAIKDSVEWMEFSKQVFLGECMPPQVYLFSIKCEVRKPRQQL